MDATRRSLQPFSTRTIEPRKKRSGSKERSEESGFSRLLAWSLIPCIRFRNFFGCGNTGRTFLLRSVRFLSVIGYILSRLGLPAYIDYSLASRYLAFDIRQRRWSDEILAATEISAECLPIPVPAGTIAGKLDGSTAGATRSLGRNHGCDGRARSTLRCIGSWALSVRAAWPTRWALTNVCWRFPISPSLTDAALAASLNSYCHVVPDKFVTLAYFPSGIMIKWFHDLLYGEAHGEDIPSRTRGFISRRSLSTTRSMEREAPAGPTGLCITPNLIGTCNPDFNPHARGIISGLGPNTTRSQIYKGILEGLACELSQMTDILSKRGGRVSGYLRHRRGFAVGSGPELRAALSGRRLHVMECPEAVCLGGAILAGVACGEYGSLREAVEVVVRDVSVLSPDPAIAAAYAQQAKQYRHLRSALTAITSSKSSSRPIGGTVMQATIGFIVFGVHKDGLRDPMGTPFIDDALVQRAKSALVAAGLKVIEHGVVVASKEEARAAFKKMKCDDAIDAVVLFSGTWVWAAHHGRRDSRLLRQRQRLAAVDASRLSRLAAGWRIGAARRFARNRRPAQICVRKPARRHRHRKQDRQLCPSFTSEKLLEHVHHRHIWRPREWDKPAALPILRNG